MYYLMGVDHERKWHLITRAHELYTIKFMRGSQRISNHPNDWHDILILKDVDEKEEEK
jgi:hypothetical protein